MANTNIHAFKTKAYLEVQDVLLALVTPQSHHLLFALLPQEALGL